MSDGKSLKDDEVKKHVINLTKGGLGPVAISNMVGIPQSTLSDFLNRDTHKVWWEENYEEVDKAKSTEGPKILTLDIETAPILGSVWRLFKQNVSLNMIEQDWFILSWAAKWFNEDEVMYQDKRNTWDNENDKELLQDIWKLLDKADIIITQNGLAFDEKKLNARFILNGMKPPSGYRHIDVLQIAKRYFGFTSNKLEYMTDQLCVKYKKLSHGKFPGFELWKQCLKGNQEAFDEMEEYNINDVLSLEELYTIVRPWYKKHPNLNLYQDSTETHCTCGSTNWKHNGYDYTNLSKYNRFQCQDCGSEMTDRVNILSKEKKESLKRNVNR